MAETQKIEAHISTILNGFSPEQREQATIQLTLFKDSAPNQLINSYVDILMNSNHLAHKTFVTLQLKNCLTDTQDAQIVNIRSRLTEDTIERVKNALFEVLEQNNENVLIKTVAKVLGELASSFIQNGEWPDFMNRSSKLFQDSANTNKIIGGFHLWKSFVLFKISLYEGNYELLSKTYKFGFQHESHEVKSAALQSFSEIAGVIDSQALSKHFKELPQCIIQTVLILTQYSGNQKSLQLLIEMLEVQSKYFRKSFNKMYEVLIKILNNQQFSRKVHQTSFDVFVNLAQTMPALFKKNKKYLNSLVDMIFVHMSTIKSEITEEWKCPPEGYRDEQESDEDYETTRLGMRFIDNFISSIGAEIIPIVQDKITNHLILSQDWRNKYSGVMVLSQIAQYVGEVQKLQRILAIIVPFLSDQNPLIRYAVCHSIGQFAQDSRPAFQQQYGEDLFNKLLNVFQYDPVPRVVSHAAAALTNLLEGIQYEKFVNKFDLFVPTVLFRILNGISIIQQNSLATIAAAMESCKRAIQPYLQELMQILFSFHTQQKYKPILYNQLKGQTIETMSIAACQIGPQMFSSSINFFIEIMKQYQGKPHRQNGPLNPYLLSGWQRIFITYKHNLASQVNNIIPGILSLIQSIVNQHILFIKKSDKDADYEDIKKTINNQDLQISIDLFNDGIIHLTNLFSPYLQRVSTLLCCIIEYHNDSQIKVKSFHNLDNVIKMAAQDNPQLSDKLVNFIINHIYRTKNIDYDSELLLSQLLILKKILRKTQSFVIPKEQIQRLTQRLLQLIETCNYKKKTWEVHPEEDEELDSIDVQNAQELMIKEDQVKNAIQNLINILPNHRKQ